MAVRALSVWQRRRQGSPFHSLTTIQTASQPKKNPRLGNGWSCELTNGMEASHTVIQTATVTQPRQSSGRLPPRIGLGPNQYRGLSSEALRVECSLDRAVRVIADNVAGNKLPGDVRVPNHAYLDIDNEYIVTSGRFLPAVPRGTAVPGIIGKFNQEGRHPSLTRCGH